MGYPHGPSLVPGVAGRRAVRQAAAEAGDSVVASAGSVVVRIFSSFLTSAMTITASETTNAMSHCSTVRLTVSRIVFVMRSYVARMTKTNAIPAALSRVGFWSVSELKTDFSSSEVSRANQMLHSENATRPMVRATSSP